MSRKQFGHRVFCRMLAWTMISGFGFWSPAVRAAEPHELQKTYIHVFRIERSGLSRFHTMPLGRVVEDPEIGSRPAYLVGVPASAHPATVKVLGGQDEKGRIQLQMDTSRGWDGYLVGVGPWKDLNDPAKWQASTADAVQTKLTLLEAMPDVPELAGIRRAAGGALASAAVYEMLGAPDRERYLAQFKELPDCKMVITNAAGNPITAYVVKSSDGMASASTLLNPGTTDEERWQWGAAGIVEFTVYKVVAEDYVHSTTNLAFKLDRAVNLIEVPLFPLKPFPQVVVSNAGPVALKITVDSQPVGKVMVGAVESFELSLGQKAVVKAILFPKDVRAYALEESERSIAGMKRGGSQSVSFEGKRLPCIQLTNAMDAEIVVEHAVENEAVKRFPLAVHATSNLYAAAGSVHGFAFTLPAESAAVHAGIRPAATNVIVGDYGEIHSIVLMPDESPPPQVVVSNTGPVDLDITIGTQAVVRITAGESRTFNLPANKKTEVRASLPTEVAEAYTLENPKEKMPARKRGSAPRSIRFEAKKLPVIQLHNAHDFPMTVRLKEDRLSGKEGRSFPLAEHAVSNIPVKNDMPHRIFFELPERQVRLFEAVPMNVPELGYDKIHRITLEGTPKPPPQLRVENTGVETVYVSIGDAIGRQLGAGGKMNVPLPSGRASILNFSPEDRTSFVGGTHPVPAYYPDETPAPVQIAAQRKPDNGEDELEKAGR